MRDAFSTALKLLLAVFLLAVGVAALDLRVIQPFRTPPCNPETLEEGHVCLSQVLKEWPGKILWIDARKQDDFERHTVTQDSASSSFAAGTVPPARPWPMN